MNQDKIVLDMKSFDALSSKTRISILKKLDIRRMTITELSNDTSLAKSTIHEHLTKLSDTGLVKTNDGGYKWKYYELTEMGKKLLHPYEMTKIYIFLSSATILFTGGFVYIFKYIKIYFWQKGYPPLEGAYDQTIYLLVGFVLISFGILFFYLSLRFYKRLRN